MLEIVSPGNKDRVRSVNSFTDKAVAALRADINLLIVDLFPPGPNDPEGEFTEKSSGVYLMRVSLTNSR